METTTGKVLPITAQALASYTMETMTGKVLAICDGQFGSTGKGLIAAAVGEQEVIDIATTNSSANAGHTACWEDGRKIIVCHLPMSGVVNTDAMIYLNAGSIIDPRGLLQEIEENNCFPRVFIHPMATVINEYNKDEEMRADSPATRIASTQKGVGSALAGKVRRIGMVAKDHKDLKKFVAHWDLNKKLRNGARVVMEVPQGFSLGYHSQFYPYCTSRQCTPAQGLADAQISPHFLGRTIMTLRTYPIRVGHLGVHSSGGWYKDQVETTWDELGLVPEKTTVTGRVRRVASFSMDQYRDALSEIQPDVLFINFLNYLSHEEQVPFIHMLCEEYKEVLGMDATPYCYYGYGPNLEDIYLRLKV